MTDIRNILNQKEIRQLDPRATPSSEAIRRVDEERLKTDYRPAFSVDVDRILNSRAYARYIDKTQVFYLIDNDHITHRVLHVQLVSKIARTIGRFLGLNEDLIEAIALGHDIGHSPFGHDGEQFLSALCQSHGIGPFQHSAQSVQFLDKVERKGKGWNLTLQTLDGILCHDGEIHNEKLEPMKHKSFDTLKKSIISKREIPDAQLVPMTLEGCVVRMSDTVSYIGRDIEDAIRMEMIRRSDIPRSCTRILGNTNGEIVYALVTDIIDTSHGSDSITFSKKASEALKALRKFNYERIYTNPKIKIHTQTIQTLFTLLFDRYLEDIEKENRASVIFKSFLEGMSGTYVQTYQKEEIVRDFIAGMTDKYFLRQCPESLRPDC